MPSKHTLNVSVTEHLYRFVEAQVASGGFSTASEVVRAALRLLERDVAGATFAEPNRQSSPIDVHQEYKGTERRGALHSQTTRNAS